MTDAEFIRDRAALGWSMAMVADAVGISYNKFRAYVKADMPDVKWTLGRSPVHRAHLESQKGNYSPARKIAMAKAIEAARMHRAVMITIGSITAPTRDLYQLYAEYVSVTYKQVMWRLRHGDDPYEAMFGARRRSCIGRKIDEMTPAQRQYFIGGKNEH